MTFEKILSDLSFDIMSIQSALDEVKKPEMLRKINFYSHFENISNEPLRDWQLQELQAIVEVLQILDNSAVGSPISDSDYDNMQELLVNMGIPRLTGTIEINSAKKVNHKYTQLRGTLKKTYYLTTDEKRTNKSRKYLDEWIKETEALYERNSGKKINLNNVKVICQPKFDGASAILEIDTKPRWITRGDTEKNLASDVSHIMNVFNDVYCNGRSGGIKFEVMVTEDDKEKINSLIRDPSKKYRNSRQIVTSILNSNEPDWKAEYLYPVPLREIYEDDDVEHVSQQLIEKFPTMVCTLNDREQIRQFANQNRYVNVNGKRFRVDGVVLTILDDNIKKVLGRERNINNFEVAYKFTEEVAYTKVKDIEFYVSDFGYITPVLVVNDVIMKGNTINHISLSNKERFDELNFSYGDDVKILYDIIPYATIDDRCQRVKNGRKIEFVSQCPRCYEDLDLNRVQVRCGNPKCPSRIVGRMLNYCTNLRIKNIGYSTLDMLYTMGLLNDGIRSLYRLHKKKKDIQDLDGFGKVKTKKIIKEIEAKRVLKDYEFFGSLGIDNMSVNTFEIIFANIRLSEFLNMMKLKNFDLMRAKLLSVQGMGKIKTNALIDYLSDDAKVNEIKSILKEVKLNDTFNPNRVSNGKVVFSGCRPSSVVIDKLAKYNYEASDSWTNSAKALVIPNEDFTSTKVEKAKSIKIPIVILSDIERKLGILDIDE